MSVSVIYNLVVIILIFGYVLDRMLSFLNRTTWKNKVPESLYDFYNEEKYQRAKAYNFSLSNLGLISESFSFAIILIFFLTGGFAWLNDLLEPLIKNKIVLTLTYFAILYLASDIIGIPFSIYRTFVIEEKYGFNKTTTKTFIQDKLKSYLLMVVIGGIIGSILISLIYWLESNFWIYAFIVITFFSLFFSMFYSTLILPLFNKLSPLEEGELRNAIYDLADKINFPLKNIYVIDGSKRSNKANAFFTGLWKKKKIVLYDTLINKHSIQELIAVLAHEVGHYKKKHIVKGLIISSLQTFIMLYVLSLLLFSPELSNAFGSRSGQYVLHINLIALAILFEPFNIVLGLAGNILSRKHEYQADHFSVVSTGGKFLRDALKKLSTDHLSNLTPHFLYVFFYYSHPPLLKRLDAIEKINLSDHEK